jgi:Tol biopolymer transport system component
LTEPGCCARHWWAADGSRVLFIDDPEGDSPLGIYSVSPQGGEVSLATATLTGENLGADAPPEIPASVDPALRLPADADNVRVSPDGMAVAWTAGSSLPVNVDRRQRSLWVVAGPDFLRTLLAVLTGGDLVGWTEDGLALVTTGRIQADAAAGIWRVPIDGSQPALLAEVERPRGTRLSHSSRWLAYYQAFDGDPTRNGLWTVATSGGSAQRASLFGSYRWGSNQVLYLIPFEPDGGPLSLMSYDPSADRTEIVHGGDAFPGGIAVNDWSVSPDNRWIVYRSAEDAALWSVPLSAE